MGTISIENELRLMLLRPSQLQPRMLRRSMHQLLMQLRRQRQRKRLQSLKALSRLSQLLREPMIR